MKLICILCVFACLLIPTASVAQTIDVSPESTDSVKEQRQKVEKKAVSLLEQTINNAELLKLPENRLYVFAATADLLWTRDQQRARALFRRAAAEINWNSVQTQAGVFQLPSNFSLMRKIRERFLEQVADRDVQLAIELLRQTRFPIFEQIWGLPVEKRKLYTDLLEAARDDLNLEKQFTIRMIKQNPQRALEIARSNLNKKPSFLDFRLIENLANTDAEAASEFANEVLQKIISNNLVQMDEETHDNLGMSFLSLFSVASSETPSKSHQLQINQAALRQLAQKCADYFLSDDYSNDPHQSLSSSLPIFEKLLPERLAALRLKAKELAATNIESSPEAEKSADESNNSLNQPDQSPDGSQKKVERLDKELNELNKGFWLQSPNHKADKLLTDLRSQVCSASDYTPHSNAFTKELESISDSYSLTMYPSLMSTSSDIKVFFIYLEAEKYSAAEQIIAQQSNNSVKIALLIQMSAQFRRKKQNEKTLQYLSEALSLIRINPESFTEMSDFSQIVQACVFLAPDKAFELLGTFIPKFNEIIAASAILSKYQQKSGMFREDELIFSDPSNNLYLGRGFGVYLVGPGSMQLDQLATTDFERTINLTEQFDRNEVRLAAQLIVLHGVLADQNPLLHPLGARKCLIRQARTNCAKFFNLSEWQR